MGLYIANTFSDALAKLPKEIKAKVATTQSNFINQKNHPGLNLEKIKHPDDDMWSIRVNDDYRIICKLVDDDNSIYLYIGKHDDAYDWAKKHTCKEDINGTITVHAAIPPKVIKKNGKMLSRFSDFSDEDFDKLDVPKVYREDIRTKVFLKKQLIGYANILPEGTYLTLEAILEGMEKEEAIEFYISLNETHLPKVEDPPLFDYTDIDIAEVGVPLDHIGLVKHCRNEKDLLTIQDMLPEAAIQNLYSLVNGEPIENIKKRTVARGKKSKEGDIQAMLDSLMTKQSIIEIADEEEFRKLLDMPMEKWRVFLHPDQRQIVEADYNGPARVIGGAGTGKTVIVVHRAKNLARKCKGNEKVLVTTYSKTLSQDIEERLKSICTGKEMSHIEVHTLDSLTNRLSDFTIKYNMSKNKPLSDVWNEAQKVVGFEQFESKFYISEWSEVIQNQQISSRDEYLTVARTGRGDYRIDRKSRDSIYSVMQEYKKIMIKNRWMDIDWAQNICAKDLRERNAQAYKYIIVDECQDFRAPAFRLIRAMAGDEHQNDLFLAGDSRQRIYSGGTTLSNCGIFVRNRSTQLNVNYRTTREILDVSLKLQKGFNYDDLDNNPTNKDTNISIMHGKPPVMKSFKTKKEELNALIEDIRKQIDQGCDPSNICIVAIENRICDWIEHELKKCNIDSLRLRQSQSDDRSESGVRIATMHRVKGMEFDSIYAVSVNDGLLPNKNEYNNPNKDKIAKLEILKRFANILAVAITRARKYVWISFYGKPSMLIEKITE